MKRIICRRFGGQLTSARFGRQLSAQAGRSGDVFSAVGIDIEIYPNGYVNLYFINTANRGLLDNLPRKVATNTTQKDL